MEVTQDRHPWLDSSGQDYETCEKLHVQRMTWKQYNVILKYMNEFCSKHGLNNLNLTEPSLAVEHGKRGRISCKEAGCTWSRALRGWQYLKKSDKIFKKFKTHTHTLIEKCTKEEKKRKRAICAFAMISKLPKKGADKSIAEAKTRKMCYDISYRYSAEIHGKFFPNFRKGIRSIRSRFQNELCWGCLVKQRCMSCIIVSNFQHFFRTSSFSISSYQILDSSF